jgi:serine/threonine protein kinase
MIGRKIVDSEEKSYTLQKEIGRGGFGVVYRSLGSDGNTYAVKVMGPANPVAIASFENEVGAASLVQHANVLGFMSYGEFDFLGEKYLFTVMEYCADGSYRSRIKAQGITSYESIVADFSQILSGLDALHQQIIHRDIKPENVLLLEGVLKIGDLGLSKFIDDATRTLTFKGGGSPSYMAPEVWERRAVSPATDLYAVGIMLFEATTGSVPFKVDDFTELRRKHLFEQAPRVKTIRSDVPDHIDGLIRRLLEKDSAHRYQSAAEVLKVLSGVPLLADSLAGIRERVRQRHDAGESQRLETQRAADAAREAQDRIMYMEQQLLSQIDDIIEQINGGLQETQIKRGGADNARYSFGERYLYVQFFPRNQLYKSPRAPGLSDVLKKHHAVHGGAIYIRDFSNRQERVRGEDTREGWNVVLVQSPDKSYGEWLLVESEISPLTGQSHRYSPVATDANLFAENLAHHWSHAMHTWQLKVRPLETRDIEHIIAKFID